MQKKAINNNLPDLIEGALGGYSSFKVETNGRITELSVMSNINREKIISLLDNTIYDDWGREKVNRECSDFVRYQFADKKEKKFTKIQTKMVQYLHQVHILECINIMMEFPSHF